MKAKAVCPVEAGEQLLKYLWLHPYLWTKLQRPTWIRLTHSVTSSSPGPSTILVPGTQNVSLFSKKFFGKTRPPSLPDKLLLCFQDPLKHPLTSCAPVLELLQHHSLSPTECMTMTLDVVFTEACSESHTVLGT